MPTIAQLEPSRITVGVDTHGEVHVACALDQLGRHVGTTRVATTPRGYRALLAWAQSLGEVVAWGVEGTGCYGAAAGGRWPDHGADPGLAVASTLRIRLFGHTPQQRKADHLGLLSSSRT